MFSELIKKLIYETESFLLVFQRYRYSLNAFFSKNKHIFNKSIEEICGNFSRLTALGSLFRKEKKSGFGKWFTGVCVPNFRPAAFFVWSEGVKQMERRV